MASDELDEEPRLQPTYSTATRIAYFLQIWALKIATNLGFALLRFLKPGPAESHPTIVKAYPCRPHLRNRIFIPRSHKAGELLPVYLDLHGGGAILCDAEFDDQFCSAFANRFQVLVVSIEYSLAPLSRFPGPSNDVVAIVNAVIEDESLPVDKARVLLGGFSAGGNLSLSASQMPGLKDKIKGVVAWYPPTDYTLTLAEREASRPYRNAKDMDDMRGWGSVFNWAYVRAGQNIKDPLLSVRFVRKEDLPKWIYMVGAEYDMLSNEARQTIFDIAGLDKMEREDGKYEFEKDTYKWTLVRDVRHGFTHDLMDNRGEEAEAIRLQRTEETMQKVGEWLLQGPFAR
jgi:acetyl esterase/lipase